MRILYYAIVPLLFVCLLDILLGGDLISVEVKYYVYDSVDKDIDSKTFDFEISTAMAILTAIITAVILLGIQILGSGLQDTTVRVVTLIILYMGIWTILSIMGWDLLFSNKIVGTIIYVFLCLFYIIGIADKIGGSGD